MKAVSSCAAFVIVALIVFAPWMARNIAWTGNPVYPLYNSFLKSESFTGGAKTETVQEAYSRMNHFQVRRHVYEESWLEIALIPLRVFIQGKDDTPKYFDGKISPFLLFLPLFAFFGFRSASRQENTEKIIMLAFSVLFLLYACAQASIRIRYFSPILPPLVLLSIFGLHKLQTTVLENKLGISDFWKHGIIVGIIFIMLCLNGIYMVDRFKKDQPLVYITGKVTRDEYIQAYRPEYASFQYANQNLAREDKIFGLYLGDRQYYSDIHIEFDIEMLQKFAAKSESGQGVAERLNEKGFTHILVNFSLFNYWVQKYSIHEKQILANFFEAHTIVLFKKDGFGLLQIIYK